MGTDIGLSDTGGGSQNESKVVNLPFTFQYYGEPYDRVTICSNGWLAMGETYLTTYRNWTIPGSGGPAAMLAVFWDDLYQTSESDVFTKYDAANHRWIVEWSRMKNDYVRITGKYNENGKEYLMREPPLSLRDRINIVNDNPGVVHSFRDIFERVRVIVKAKARPTVHVE